ncbi:hypothetical protein TWF569_010825 [Orbilia oligospora]|nr:hypothetical protein TWF706_009571 [Orbilia oligospora]KAF3132540.1 hypothetical protein TWF569_010825 [Orbilia oligospora]KAF3151303.1 hypothetical protein TWF594_006956 [Orbilia oligospora]
MAAIANRSLYNCASPILQASISNPSPNTSPQPQPQRCLVEHTPGLSKRPNGVSSTSTVLTKQLSARKSLSQDVQRSLDGAVEFQKTERPKLAETYLKAGITNWLPELLLSKKLEKIQLWRSQSLHNNTYGIQRCGRDLYNRMQP